MTTEFVISLGKDTLTAGLWIVGPILLVGFVVGMIVSVVQSIMQLHEMTLATVPKLFAIGASLILFGNWMLNHLIQYSKGLLGGFPNMIGH